MKVVHIIEALGGGVYTYFEDLTHHFEKVDILKKVQTEIIYSPNRLEINPAEVVEMFSTIPNRIVDMRREISPRSDLKAINRLILELNEIKPDIVHLHSSKAGVLGRIACFFLFKKPIVFYTPHGYAFLRTDISKSVKKTYWIIEKMFQKFFGGVTIACGDSEYKLASKMGKAEMIRNGIDLEAIQKYSFPINNPKLKIGIAGRITAARNPKLFNTIALQFPQYQFVWIGDGEQHDQITAPNIKVTGWKFDKKQVYQQINELDVYLQTSLWEGLPIAVLEAMALQKPVVATKVNGNIDTVVSNETGFLFDDVSELAVYFKTLENKQTRTVLGKNALERCKVYFDKSKNFDSLAALYERYFFLQPNASKYTEPKTAECNTIKTNQKIVS